MERPSVHLEWRDIHLSVDSAAPSQLLSAPRRAAASLRARLSGPRPTPLSTTPAALGPTERALLSGVSGCVRPGQLMAIMGPSGAGKTTLLNLLAGRLAPAPGVTIRGSVLVNGAPRSPAAFQDMTAYVEQDDAMHAALTVREQIDFAARLRLPQTTTPAQRAARVDAVLAELDLTAVADRRVGGDAVRGVSGGERKRTAIGVALVTDPQLLVCDEPTAGLDAAAALAVVRTLRALAAGGGKTVVTTIHQPRGDAFDAFDGVTLLAGGRVVFGGAPRAAVPYFGALGWACPRGTHVADFLLDTVAPPPVAAAAVGGKAGGDGGGGDGAAGAAARLWARLGAPVLQRLGVAPVGGVAADPLRSPTHGYVRLGVDAAATGCDGTGGGVGAPPVDHVAFLADAYGRHLAAAASPHGVASPSKTRGARRVRFAVPVPAQSSASALAEDGGSGGAATGVAGSFATSPWHQLGVLLHRTYLLEVREARAAVATLVQVTAIASVLGLSFLSVGRSTAYATGSVAGISTMVRLLGVFGVMVATLAPIAMHVHFPLERVILLRERAARSYRTSVFFVVYTIRGFLRGIVQAVLLTAVLGSLVGLRGSGLPAFVVTATLVWFAAESLALVVAATFDDIKTAVSVTPTLYSALFLYSGFLIQPERLPAALRWLHYASFLSYAFAGMVRAQLGGVVFANPLECGTCLPDGERAMASFGISATAGGVWGNAAAVAGMVCILRLVGYGVVLARGPSFAKMV